MSETGEKNKVTRLTTVKDGRLVNVGEHLEKQKPLIADRRKFFKRTAPIIGGTVIGLAAGLTAHVVGNEGRSAEQQFSQRTAITSTKETGKSNETAIKDIIPHMFLPGKTSIDLTRAKIRTSPETKDSVDEHNAIDLSEISEIENVPVDEDAKTMFVENAKLEEGTVGNDVPSRWTYYEARLKDGRVIKIDINYDHTKDSGIVQAQADNIGESGFIREGLGGKYHGEIPRLNEDPTIVKPEQMNKVSFSTAPISPNP